MAQRQQLELHYRKPGQPAETRLVDPYHLANINGEWFLFAYDHARKDIRTFVPARIQSVKPTGKTFERTQKFSLEKRLRDSFGVHSGEGEFEVVIRFNARAADYIREKKWHPSQTLARIEGRRRGIENEAVQPGRSATLGLELGRRCEGVEAARTGRGRQKISGGDIKIAGLKCSVRLLWQRRSVTVAAKSSYFLAAAGVSVLLLRVRPLSRALLRT